MGKYTASSRFNPTRVASLLAAALLSAVAGCATEPPEETPLPPPAPTVAAAPAAAPRVEPLDSNGAASAAAGRLSLRETAPLRYVVKKGDTFWGLANYYLRDAWQWPELWYVNGQVRNPHLIYPGEVLSLVTVDGRTRLTRESGLDVERRSPQVRELPLDAALPAIPIEAIRDFLRGPRLVTLEESQHAPYVIAFVDEHIVTGANNEVFVKNLPANRDVNYAVVQIGDAYRDPDNGELLGYEAIPAGEAELRTDGQPARMRLTKSSREVLIGDRLLPIEAENFGANFYPHPPTTPVEGRIISVFDGLSQIAQYQIVALNRGSNHGLDAGTVLDIAQTGRVVADPYGAKAIALPDQYAGVLMVFKVTPKLSYGLVLSAVRSVHVFDKVRKPTPSH